LILLPAPLPDIAKATSEVAFVYEFRLNMSLLPFALANSKANRRLSASALQLETRHELKLQKLLVANFAQRLALQVKVWLIAT